MGRAEEERLEEALLVEPLQAIKLPLDARHVDSCDNGDAGGNKLVAPQREPSISTTASISPMSSSQSSTERENSPAGEKRPSDTWPHSPTDEHPISEQRPPELTGAELEEEAIAPVLAPAAPTSGGTTSPSSLRARLVNNVGRLTVKPHAAPAQQQDTFRQLLEGQVIEDFYEIEDEIYRGSLRNQSDKVISVKRRSDNSELVMKIRTKRRSGAGERRWREIMQQLTSMSRNNHVLDILEIVEDSSAYYIVMPKCKGGELLEFLTVAAEVPESECKRITREILLAVGHLHKHSIVHRDVKPENLMFHVDPHAMPDTPKTVKLLDWDTCVEWTPQSPKKKIFAGTPGYIAPEALLGEATPQSDLYSVGVILFILMTGVLPWSKVGSLEDGLVGSTKATRMYHDLKAEAPDWDMEPWPFFPQARDLCQKLLAFDPAHRLNSVDEALAHIWLSEGDTAVVERDE